MIYHFEQISLKRVLVCVCGLSLIVLAGCNRSEVAAYDIPKETPPAQAMPANTSGSDPHAGMARSRPSLNWGALPEGWVQSAEGSGMRLATFTIEGEDGQTAEMAIIPMGGFAGTDEQLVNMWRMQLGLPELAQAKVGEQGETFTVDGAEGNLYEMAGTAENTPTRLLVASVNSDGVNYFFKLIGHDALVASKKDAFLKFLEGVEFGASSTASEAPPTTNPLPSDADQRWSAPDGWEQLPATQFLLAKYRIPAGEGAGAMVSISQLGGSAGGLLPNVNRWRGQLNLAPVDEAGLKPLLSDLKVGSADATLVTLEGTDLQTGAPGKMLVVVVTLPSETWFFKLTGPVGVVDEKTVEFQAFVGAARF